MLCARRVVCVDLGDDIQYSHLFVYDQRPCLAGAEKWDSRRRQLLLASITLYLSHLYNRDQSTGFETEEPRHTPRIISFLVCPITHCSQTQLQASKIKDFARSLMERRAKPWVPWQGFIPRAQHVAYCQVPLMHRVHACREGRRDQNHSNHTDSIQR